MGAAVVPSARPWRRAAAWLVFLGPFFFVTYGFATWLTAQRASVGSVVFGWEQGLPFVPWTIAPYWSIDLLYGLSLFLCTDKDELDTHARRLLTAQVISVACFVLFPLRFSFARPPVDGGFGWMFRTLESFDQPFNQAPSLHIALLVILWALYARKLGPVGRIAVHVWFALIAVSVLTTWQHHFIDLPTGVLLGFFCLWLWPQANPSPLAATAWTGDRTRWRLAAYYALGAALAAIVAALIGGAGLWLLWVTVALGLVALNYARIGSAGFQKRDGRLSPAARVLLAPYVAGAAFNAWAWTRSRPFADHVADDVWIGRLPSRDDLTRGGFAAIVDLTCELPVDAAGHGYDNVAMLDLVTCERTTLLAAVEAIERQRAAGRLLVCCALGYSRSATAVAAWLLATGHAADTDAAIARVRAARSAVVLGDSHRAAIGMMAVHAHAAR